MTNEDRIAHLEKQIDFMSGELGALKAFCTAVTAVHGSPADLGRVFNLMSETMLSGMLNEAVSDTTIDGLKEASLLLQDGVERRKKTLAGSP